MQIGRTVTVDVAASAGNLNFSDPQPEQVTFTVNQPLTIAGSLTLNAQHMYAERGAVIPIPTSVPATYCRRRRQDHLFSRKLIGT
jgi:hypothetical protein